jgi:restriction endonuclease Mrr
VQEADFRDACRANHRLPITKWEAGEVGMNFLRFHIRGGRVCRLALEFVSHLSQRVILIDGEKLADLMIEHNVGVRLNRAIEFKRLDEDFFAEDD